MLALQDRQPYYSSSAGQPRSDYSYNLVPKDRDAAVGAAQVPAQAPVASHEYQQDNYYYSSRPQSKSLNSSAPSTNHSSPQHSQVNTSPSLPSIYDPNGPVAAAYYSGPNSGINSANHSQVHSQAHSVVHSQVPSQAPSQVPSQAPSQAGSAPMSPNRLPMPVRNSPPQYQSPTTNNPYAVGVGSSGQLLNQPFNQPMTQQQLQMQQLQLQQQQIQQIQQLQQQQVQQQQFQAQAAQQSQQYYGQQVPQQMMQMGYQQQMHPHSHLMNQFSSKRQFRTLKKHVCTVCGKRFTRPSSLQTHTYSHTGEKPFRCEFSGCGRQFSVVSNLRRHQKIHSPRE
ncbi:Zinc finger protein [Yarrowia sp. C11]|nr:Zinc finger protein [Yarrowia sp. C11]KAG5363916.1 Zinc finger protein [Yarrowia sp. E02]